MLCDHSGPTPAMHTMPAQLRPHAPMKPRESALIPAVTEPPKIVLYYRLSRSTWPLSNNKELFCRFRRVKPGKSHTTGSLICAKPTRRRDQSTTLHYIKGSQV
jgi:hypothetical protein